MVTWECDYPHSDSNWPESPEVLAQSMVGVSDEDVDKITHLNAMKHYNYDPFSVLGGREKCTVGALGGSVRGHDTAIRSQRREGEQRTDAVNAASQLARIAAHSAN
jgi:hypothetical protein